MSAAVVSRSAVSPRPTKGGHVYDELKEAILSGALSPGTLIDKAELCDRLGVSRFPVTTAINRLAFEGLVIVEPQHGSFVARIALGEVLECMLLRAAIEAETAGLAAERQPAGLCEALDRNLRYQVAASEAGDVDGFYLLDVGFHEAILASLGLAHAAAVLDGLRGRLERIRRILSAPPDRMTRTREDHLAIRRAIASGDGAGARSAMRHHLDATATLFRAFAQDRPGLFSEPT